MLSRYRVSDGGADASGRPTLLIVACVLAGALPLELHARFDEPIVSSQSLALLGGLGVAILVSRRA